MSHRNDYKRTASKTDQNNPKLEWMYKGSSDLLNREEYLLGRSIDKNFEQLDSAAKNEQQKLIGVQVPKNHVEYECIPFSIREYKQNTQSTEQVDLQRKIMEDPLIAIKQKEIDTRKKLLENPVKLKEIHRLLKIEQDQKNKMHRKKVSKKSSKKKKHKRSSSVSESNSSDTDLDKKLIKKLKKSGGLDKLMKKKYDALTKELDSSVGKTKHSKKSKSSEELSTDTDNHHKKRAKRKSSDSDSDDELDEILTKKFKSIKDTAGLKALLAESAEKKSKPRIRKISNSDRSEKSSPDGNHFNRKVQDSTEHRNPFREQSGFKNTAPRGSYRGGRGFRGNMSWNRRGNFNRGGQTNRGNFNSSYSRNNDRYQKSRSKERFQKSLSKERHQRSRSRDRFHKSSSKERYQKSRSGERDRNWGRDNVSNRKLISKNFQHKKRPSLSPETKPRENKHSLSRENSIYEEKNYDKEKLRSEQKRDFLSNKSTYYKDSQRSSRDYKQKTESSRSRSHSRPKQAKDSYRREEASTSYDNKYKNDSYNNSKQQRKPFASSRSQYDKADHYKKISSHQDNKKDHYDSIERRSSYDKYKKETIPRKPEFSKKKSSRKSGSFHSDSEDRKFKRKSYENSYKKKSISKEENLINTDNKFNKKKLSEDEKERMRQEMMEAATKRDIERTQKVHTYRKQVEKEENLFKSTKFDTQFANNELKKAYSSSKSIESRIKSNLNNIQRSSGAMDRNFARK